MDARIGELERQQAAWLDDRRRLMDELNRGAAERKGLSSYFTIDPARRVLVPKKR